MFLDGRERRMEERINLRLRNCVYRLIIAIDRDFMRSAAREGIRVNAGMQMAEPWRSDFMLAKEMEKELSRRCSEEFIRLYGNELERMEVDYNIY